MKSALVLLSFCAAVLFFILAAFAISLADVPLVPAGLVSLAAGFLIERLPDVGAH